MSLHRVLQPGWAKRLAGSPYFAALTAAAAAVVGVVGSVYQNEIAGAFPLVPLGPFGGWSWRAFVFWISLGLLAWLVFLRQIADDDVRNRLVDTTGSAEAISRRIETFVQTLPPAGFQAQLTALVLKSNEWISKGMPRELRSDLPPSELIPVIRALLHGLASLALAYDGNPLVDGHSALYSANVMVFVPNDHAQDLTLKFHPPEHDRTALKGALLLRQDLSATSTSHDPDTSVAAIALPVPQAAEKAGRWVALLGGPRAFLTGTVDGYVDTASFVQQCTTRGDFQPSVLAELENYFTDGAGSAVRSFVSRRLEFGDESVGVLNLHANRQDLLGPRLEKRESFQALATPLVVDLAAAVAILIRRNGYLPLRDQTGTMEQDTQ